MTFRMMAVIVGIALGCVTSAEAEPVQDLMTPAVFQDSFVGQKTAPVTLVVYSSPTCSHCVDFHERDLPKLQDTYVARSRTGPSCETRWMPLSSCWRMRGAETNSTRRYRPS
jgi:hypothetical protein